MSNRIRQGLKEKEKKIFKYNKENVVLNINEHEKLTDCMKESICLFIEKFFTSLDSEQDYSITTCTQKLIKPIVHNLHKAIDSQKITLQLEYLNLLTFLMFKTQFSETLGPLNIKHKLLGDISESEIIHFAENKKKRNQMEEEIKEEKNAKSSRRNSKKNTKRNSVKDTDMDTLTASESHGMILLKALKNILQEKIFLKTLLKGLNNEHNFVMTKYVEYLNRLLFFYTKLFTGETLLTNLSQVIFTYLDVIFENATCKGPLKDQEKRKEKVISLLKGLKFFLSEVLQVTQVEIKNERNVEKALLAIFTLGIVSSKGEGRKKMIFQLDEFVCMNLINNFSKLFNKLLQTYQSTSLLSDIDIYRMLSDPSMFTSMKKDSSISEKLNQENDGLSVKHSLNDSIISGSILDAIDFRPSFVDKTSYYPTFQFGILNSKTIDQNKLVGISKYVFKIMNPLANNFVMKSVEAIINNWAICNKTSLGLSGLDLLDFSVSNMKKNQSESNSNLLMCQMSYEDFQKSDIHIKILETLLYINICPSRLLLGILYSMQMEEIKKNRRDFDNSRYSKKIVFWTEHAQKEIDLLSFVFAYIKYCCSSSNFKEEDSNKLNNSKLTEFSSSLLSILKIFEGVENILTYMWILDIISLFLQKFQNCKSLFSKNKTEWKAFISELWTKIGKIINDVYKFEIEDMRGKSLDQKNVNDPKKTLIPLKPISPSLRGVSKNVMYNLAKHFRGEEEEKDKIFDYLKYDSNEMNIVRYKYFLLITLKKSLYQICDMFFSSSKSGSSQNSNLSNSELLLSSVNSRRSVKLPEDSSVWSIVKLKPLLDKLISTLKMRKENSLIIQEISEILLILSVNKSFLNDFKQELLDIFDSDEFFKCDVNTLKMWSRIVDRVLDFNKGGTVVEYYMKNIDFKGVFVFKDTENKKRMKCFLRICFIIYAGDAEKYLDKKTLNNLLEKIKSLLKEENEEPRLTILILFSLRILIMRLQKQSLNELFKTIWPSIIFLLRKLIKSKSSANEEVFLASMKLLELISSTDIPEFNLHKWSFMFEYYGVSLTILDNHSINKNEEGYISQMDFIKDEDDDSKDEKLIGFHVNPFLMAQMPPSTLIQFDKNNNQPSSLQKSQMGVIQKRKIVITENSLDDIKLEHKIHQFLTYVTHSSTQDIQLDKDDLECVIERDFIDFGKYLLK